MNKKKKNNMESATPLYKELMAMVDPHKRLDRAHAGCRMRMRELVFRLVGSGYGRIRVASVRRSLALQQQLYGRGRTAAECEKAGVPVGHAKPELPQVTWVDPEESKHVQGEAIDLDITMYAESNYHVFGSIAAGIGATWGGDWKVRDYGHFEW